MPSRAMVPTLAPVAPAVPPSSIHVQVGRLSLDGFDLPPGGDRQVQAAFERELSRLISGTKILPSFRSGGARRELPGGLLSISGWRDPGDLGRQIARAIYERMER